MQKNRHHGLDIINYKYPLKKTVTETVFFRYARHWQQFDGKYKIIKIIGDM